MALGIDDVLEGAAVPAVLAGIGLAVAAPFLVHGLGAGGRRVTKAVIHKYLDLADKMKEAGAETREKWSDLLAEVHAERAAHESEPSQAASEVLTGA